MEWFGPRCKVETVQEAAALFFQIAEQRRKIDYLIPVALFAACVVAFGFGSPMLALFVGVCAALFSYQLFGLGTYSVEVTETKLSSKGNLSKFGGGSSTFLWKDIHGLEYGNLGEDGPSGLCVKTGRWSRACIAPGVDQEQAASMIFQIYQRFPSPPLADPPAPLATMLKEAISVILLSKKG